MTYAVVGKFAKQKGLEKEKYQEYEEDGPGEEDGPWSSGWAERCGCNTTPFRSAVSHKDCVCSRGVKGCTVEHQTPDYERLEEDKPILTASELTLVVHDFEEGGCHENWLDREKFKQNLETVLARCEAKRK